MYVNVHVIEFVVNEYISRLGFYWRVHIALLSNLVSCACVSVWVVGGHSQLLVEEAEEEVYDACFLVEREGEGCGEDVEEGNMWSWRRIPLEPQLQFCFAVGHSHRL